MRVCMHVCVCLCMRVSMFTVVSRDEICIPILRGTSESHLKARKDQQAALHLTFSRRQGSSTPPGWKRDLRACARQRTAHAATYSGITQGDAKKKACLLQWPRERRSGPHHPGLGPAWRSTPSWPPSVAFHFRQNAIDWLLVAQGDTRAGWWAEPGHHIGRGP